MATPVAPETLWQFPDYPTLNIHMAQALVKAGVKADFDTLRIVSAAVAGVFHSKKLQYPSQVLSTFDAIGMQMPSLPIDAQTYLKSMQPVIIEALRSCSTPIHSLPPPVVAAAAARS